MRACRLLRVLLKRFQDEPSVLSKLKNSYIIVWELADVLTAVSAGRCELITCEFGDDVYFFNLPAAVLDHFGDGSLFCAETADCLFDVASGVILAVGAEDAWAYCEIGVGTVCPRSWLEGQLMHFLHFFLINLWVLHMNKYMELQIRSE